MADKNGDKMGIFVAEFLDCTKGYVNFEGSFAVHKWSWFAWIALAGPCFTFCACTPYTLCTGHHFKPAQSLLLYRVATTLCNIYTHKSKHTIHAYVLRQTYYIELTFMHTLLILVTAISRNTIWYLLICNCSIRVKK